VHTHAQPEHVHVHGAHIHLLLREDAKEVVLREPVPTIRLRHRVTPLGTPG
jgi:hypothetical protein